MELFPSILEVRRVLVPIIPSGPSINQLITKGLFETTCDGSSMKRTEIGFTSDGPVTAVIGVVLFVVVALFTCCLTETFCRGGAVGNNGVFTDAGDGVGVADGSGVNKLSLETVFGF